MIRHIRGHSTPDIPRIRSWTSRGSEIKLVKTICVHCLDPACQVSNFDDSQVHGQAYLNVFGLVLPQSLDV